MTSSVKTLNENLSEGLTGIEYIQMAVNQVFNSNLMMIHFLRLNL